MAASGNKKSLTAQERAAAERREELRNRVIMGAVVLICVLGIVWLYTTAAPEKQLTCDGGSVSLLQFGSCR